MNSTMLFGIPHGGEWIIILVAMLIPLLCIIDILRNDFRYQNAKLIWFAVVAFFPVVGSLLYYWIGTEQKTISRG